MSAPASDMPAGPNSGAATTNSSPEDALDRGVDQVMQHTGHPQSRSTTEKISDGVRKIFKKATGKDVPIEDKN